MCVGQKCAVTERRSKGHRDDVRGPGANILISERQISRFTHLFFHSVELKFQI